MKGFPDTHLGPIFMPCAEGLKLAALWLWGGASKCRSVSRALCLWRLALIAPYYTLGTQKSIEVVPCPGGAHSQLLSFGKGQTWI